MPMGSHNDDEQLDTRRRFPMEFESRERVPRVHLDSYEFKKSVSRSIRAIPTISPLH
jgi:hypothetical protein